MDILLEKQFYLNVATLMAKLVSLPEFMIIATALNDPSCIIYALHGQPCKTENRGQAFMPCESASLIHAVHYKPLQPRDEEVDKHNAVENQTETQIEIEKTN